MYYEVLSWVNKSTQNKCPTGVVPNEPSEREDIETSGLINQKREDPSPINVANTNIGQKYKRTSNFSMESNLIS